MKPCHSNFKISWIQPLFTTFTTTVLALGCVISCTYDCNSLLSGLPASLPVHSCTLQQSDAVQTEVSSVMSQLCWKLSIGQCRVKAEVLTVTHEVPHRDTPFPSLPHLQPLSHSPQASYAGLLDVPRMCQARSHFGSLHSPFLLLVVFFSHINEWLAPSLP